MKDFCKNLKFTWNYAKNKKKEFILIVITSIISIIINIVIPILYAKETVNITDNKLYQLLIVGFLIFIIEIARNIIRYIFNNCTRIIYRDTLGRLQIDLGRHVLKLTNSTIDAKSSGVFIQRLTNDTSKLADVFFQLSGYLSDVITEIGIFGAIFIISKEIFVYLLIEVLVLYLIEGKRTKINIENENVYRKENEKVSGFIGEMVRGLRDIKMLNSEVSFIDALKEKIYLQNIARHRQSQANNCFNLLSSSLIDLSDILIIIVIIYFLASNKLDAPSAIILLNYSGRVPYIVNYFGSLLEEIKDFNLSSSRIYAIINSEEFPKESFGVKHLDKIEGDFEFKNVTFSYNGDKLPVLKNLSFKVNSNETVAFVGKSGAGKTTIFSLLCRMYDVKDGTITIDGVDIRKLDKDTIRGNITIISQNPYIFNLSIRDNLKLVKENLTDEEMKEACKLACLDDFIEKLPKKYETVLGEGGLSLSGGQRQRLAIARALVQKTEIILFDEATSALDNETQSKIQQAIQNMKGEYTILIIAHRLSTIINSDRIMLIEDGRVKAIGTHEELLAKEKSYRNLYEGELKHNK